MKDLFSLDGKVALVTGGTRGIGLMMARGLVTHGAKVYVASRKAEACEAAAKELSQIGTCIGLPASLGSDAGCRALAAEIAEREPALHVLVNNAGANWGAPLADYPDDAWDKVLALNVKGVFHLTRALLPQLEQAASAEDPARVINVGSIDGIKTPVFETFSYGPSKAAVHHLTRVMAAHLVKENILVNAIAPGPFPTYMLSTGVGGRGDVENTDWDAVGRGNPRGRVGTPQDIAGIAIFLSSRAGAFTVGDVIVCDGGSVVSS